MSIPTNKPYTVKKWKLLTIVYKLCLKMTVPAYLPVASTSSHVLDWASRQAQSPSIATKTKKDNEVFIYC